MNRKTVEKAVVSLLNKAIDGINDPLRLAAVTTAVCKEMETRIELAMKIARDELIKYIRDDVVLPHTETVLDNAEYSCVMRTSNGRASINRENLVVALARRKMTKEQIDVLLDEATVVGKPITSVIAKMKT